MRPEVGTTQGVAKWAEGAPYCTVICKRGHKRRLIERIKWAGPNGRGGHLYTAGARTLEDTDPGTSAELNPTNDEYKWRLRCPCGLDVPLSSETLDRLAKGLHDTGVRRIELEHLAAIVSE